MTLEETRTRRRIARSIYTEAVEVVPSVPTSRIQGSFCTYTANMIFSVDFRAFRLYTILKRVYQVTRRVRAFRTF